MKKRYLLIVSILSLSFFLTACTGDNIAQGMKEDQWNSDKVDSKFLEEIYTLTDKKEPNEVFKFLNDNQNRLKNVKKKDKTEAFYIVEGNQKDFQNKYLDYLNQADVRKELNKFMPENGDLLEEDLEKIKDKDIKEKIEKIIEGNFLIRKINYKYYPLIDYNNLNTYSQHLEDDCQNYFLLEKNNQELLLEEKIDYKKYFDILLMSEKYLSKYKASFAYDNVLRIYDEKLWTLLSELDKSTDEQGDFILDKDLLEEYKNFSYDSIASKAIGNLISRLENSDTLTKEEFQKKLINIHSEAILKLE